MVSKSESRRITDEIRQVLLNVWDPIGVGDFPECADEYDCCIGGVYALLMNRANDDEVAKYLWERANHHMGLTVSTESMMPRVAVLKRINLEAQKLDSASRLGQHPSR